jgi:hypothetical protein
LLIGKLAGPHLPAPVVSGELVVGSLDAARPGAVALLTGWNILLNSHVGVPESDDTFLTILTGFHNKLFATLHISARAVAGEVSRVHFLICLCHFQMM